MKQAWDGLPTIDELYDLLLKGFRRWRYVDDEAQRQLLALLVLAQQEEAEGEGQTAVHALLLRSLDAVRPTHKREIEVVEQRFLKEKRMGELELDFGLTRDSLNRLQREGILALAAWLQREEMAARKAIVQSSLAMLPEATYRSLFGQSEAVAEIAAWLLAAESGLLAVVGLGGSGKTALVDAVVREVVASHGQNGRFAGLVWVRVESVSMSGRRVPERSWEQVCVAVARQIQMQLGMAVETVAQPERFVREHLAQQRWLVVVDNVEAADEASYLFERLRGWVRPSRVLVTTRVRPEARVNAWIYLVNGLGEADSIGLIRYEAEQLGLREVALADRAQLVPVWRVTGGNPLALKLVVGLGLELPLPMVVADLQKAQLMETEAMYVAIYRRAWQALSEDGQVLLEAMPLVGERGGTIEQMQAMSGLVAERPFWAAVRELTGRSLLELRENAWERRYGIHGLTESFLRTEIIHWFEEEE